MCDSSDYVDANSEILGAFSTWRTEQPELEGSGFVAASVDLRDVSMTLWWVGPPTEFQERVLTEAQSRGIKARIRVAKYSMDDRHRAARLAFDASEALAAVGFEIVGGGGFDGNHDGLRIAGFDPSDPKRPLDDSTRSAVLAVLGSIDAFTEVMDLSDVLIERRDHAVLL